MSVPIDGGPSLGQVVVVALWKTRCGPKRYWC